MNSEEALRIFESLRTILQDFGLAWLVEQVSHEIPSGKEVSKRVSVESEEFAAIGRPRRQITAFVSTVPYTAQEQLLLLVGAMEHAVAGIAEMQEFLLEFTNNNGRFVGARFVPEVPGAEGFSFMRSDVESRLVSAKELQNLCAELRGEAENGN